MNTRFRIIILIVLAIGSFSYGGDVYNFYFQKGKNPKSVIQGENGQNIILDEQEDSVSDDYDIEVEEIDVQDTVEDEDTEPRKDDQLQMVEKKPYNPKFGIILGVSQMNIFDTYEVGSTEIGLSYRFNKYLGVELVSNLCDSAQLESRNSDLYSREEDVWNDSGNKSNWNACDSIVGGERTYRGGITFTPIHGDFIGHQFFDITFHLGAQELTNFETFGYFGASASFYLNKNFKLSGYVNTTKYFPQYGLSMGIMF